MSWGVVLDRGRLLGRGQETTFYFSRLVELDCLPGILCVLSGGNVHPRGLDIPNFCYLVLAKSDRQIDLGLNLRLLHRCCDNNVLAHPVCCAPRIRAVARATISCRSGCGREKLSFGPTLHFVLGWIKFRFQIDRFFLIFVDLGDYLLLRTLSRNIIFEFFSAVCWACWSHRAHTLLVIRICDWIWAASVVWSLRTSYSWFVNWIKFNKAVLIFTSSVVGSCLHGLVKFFLH